MSKKWGAILVAAFLLGFGLKKFIASSESPVPAANNSATFTSANQQGVDLYDLDDSRVRIVYFGFTHCPDVCPTSLAMLSAALKQIDESQLNQILPLFITLDPERDTPEKVHQYSQYFHPNIVGLSAPIDTVKPIAEKYGVIFQRTELKDSQLQYTIDHNSYFYFLKPNGDLITKIPHTLNPAPLVAAIQQL